MAGRKMAKRSRGKRGRNPTASLTDDLMVEILSRLPVKSLCRFKCVSRRWHGLISDPDHRRRLPQTLAGLFYSTHDRGRLRRRFANLWEIDRPPLVCASFSFVPRHENLTILDSCSGLLLCRRSETGAEADDTDVSCYVVCNPATQSWVALPGSAGGEASMARLGFDHAASRNFHVFEFVDNEDDEYVAGVKIYSSGTGAWSYMESGWNDPETCIYSRDSSVFLNGLLHIHIEVSIVTVDLEGKTWRMLALPEAAGHMSDYKHGFLGRYQGHLCYIHRCGVENELSVWVCEDYAAENWMLKHRVSVQRLTENMATDHDCQVITIHPGCDWILYVSGRDETLMAYDIDREQVHVIQDLGSGALTPYIPYVPFYSGSLTDGH